MKSSREMSILTKVIRVGVDVTSMEELSQQEREQIGLLEMKTSGKRAVVKDIPLLMSGGILQLMNENILPLTSEVEEVQEEVGIPIEDTDLLLRRGKKGVEPGIVNVVEVEKDLAVERERRLIIMTSLMVIVKEEEVEEEGNSTNHLHREKPCPRTEYLLEVPGAVRFYPILPGPLHYSRPAM